MKKLLKYIIGICFIGMFLLMFLPLINLSTYELSLFDLLKFLYGLNGDLIFSKDIEIVLNQYLQPYIIFLTVLFIYPLLSGLLSIIFKDKMTYIVSMINTILLNIYVVIGSIICYQKFKYTLSVFSFFNMSDAFFVKYMIVIIWILISILIIVLSVLGIRASKMTIHEDNEYLDYLPESFDVDKNPWRDLVLELEDEDEDDFTGAILGTGDIYKDYVYLLKDKIEVFFIDSDGCLDIVKKRHQDMVAVIYYISEYKEYCIKPFDKKIIYLESGQPLGKGRYYYLPRGTKIYIKKDTHSFQLG